jgi:predicted site-specific integrase-resolvase
VPDSATLPPHPILADRASALTLAEAAEYFGVAPNTLRRWMADGVRGVKLPTLYVGGRRFVRRADAARFLEEIQEGVRDAR